MIERATKTQNEVLQENTLLPLALSDVHSEAVQAVLARHVERKMAVPMPSKRRSLVVQTSMDAYTPPGDEAHTETHTCTTFHSCVTAFLTVGSEVKHVPRSCEHERTGENDMDSHTIAIANITIREAPDWP